MHAGLSYHQRIRRLYILNDLSRRPRLQDEFFLLDTHDFVLTHAGGDPLLVLSESGLNIRLFTKESSETQL